MKLNRNEWGMLLVLVAVAIASRLAKEWGLFSAPNFHAVAAASLFAGYYFRSRAVAAIVPLAAMAATDFVIGGHYPIVMVSVYGCLLLPILFRSYVRSGNYSWMPTGITHPWLRIGIAAVANSLIFFTLTNFATWCTPMYAHTLRGLTRCFTAAIPFYQYTLMGDVMFAAAIFGVYAWMTAPSTVASSELACEQ